MDELNHDMLDDGLKEPLLAPAEADPATAALAQGADDEALEAMVPEEEQEDPYAGRELPDGEPPVPPGIWEEEGADAAVHAGGESPEVPPVPAPVSAPPGAAVRSARLLAPASAAAEAPAAEDAARREYWRSVLTGSAETVPEAVRQRAGVEDGSLADEQREYRLLSAINRSWAADHMGVSREQVRSGWPRLRAELAERFHVADDEQELFAALSQEAQNAPRREVVQSLYERHCLAALLGEELEEDDEVLASQGALPWSRELVAEARRRGEELRHRHLPLARELAEGVQAFAALEEDAVAAPRVVGSVPELARSVESLAGMDERSRQLVYALAQAELRQQVGEEPEGLYRMMLRASRRGATQLGYGVGQALAHASVASLNSLGTLLGEERGRSLREGAAGLDLRARIVDEARSLLHEQVRPLLVREEAGLAAQMMVDAAGATPSALVACCGGAGFASIGLSGAGQLVAEARRRAPEGSQQLQYLAGVVGSGIQASIYAGMSRVGGQLLSNAINRFARASGKGAGAYVLPGLGVLGAMGVEEGKLLAAGKAAGAAALGAQELAARMERTASNIDWKAYGDNAQDVELNMREAAMNLPFILIASGRVALRHFRSRSAVLGEGHALLDWGIDEGTRDAIMKERNVDRQGEMLRDALRGSRRWSAPGFLAEAVRALSLLNTDYYQGFRNPQTVVDFLRLPSEGGLVPRPPFRQYSAENPEHVQELMERHGVGDKVNRNRLAIALQLWDEWCQKAHLIPSSAGEGGSGDAGVPVLPTAERRRHFGLELLRLGKMMPRRVRPGGFYAPYAEPERMAILRDRVAELHDLSYQMLLAAFPVDALSHNPRGLDHMRSTGESARRKLLESVGRAVIRRATGVPEFEALSEMGRELSVYFTKRRYGNFPPLWMKGVQAVLTQRLDEYATATAFDELPDAAPELLDAYRVALGVKACANALYELLPMTADFQSALSRGMSPAQAYVHLLSRELEVDLANAKGVEALLAPLGANVTDMNAYHQRNREASEAYILFTGGDFERGKGGETGANHWRLRRPDGHYTRWHRRKSDVVNDLAANASFMFMPFNHDRMKAFHHLEAGQDYDLASAGQAKAWQYSGYDQLCRVALRDSARLWLERAPYALPGFGLRRPRRYVFLGGARASVGPQIRFGEEADTVLVERNTLTTPLSLAQARFYAYWWRQLNAGVISAHDVGEELVRARVMSAEELEQVKDIAKPLLMPRNPNVPLKYTPPPDVAGMNRAMATYLTDFSMRCFLAHLDDMPLPPSAREWYRLAPLCPLVPGKLPERALRLSLNENDDLLTCWANRSAAAQLRLFAPRLDALRRAEREGLLPGHSRLMTGFRNAVGLNRYLGTEQAWCMRESGTEAFMSAGARFWQLMERPVEGWLGMDDLQQDSLRRHIGNVCRDEITPFALESEARGESPDYVLSALQNLQEVLQECPLLHQFGLAGVEGRSGVQQMLTESAVPLANPFEEPEYDMLPLYTGGSMKEGFRLEDVPGLPETLQDDSRVMPALHLLRALRRYPGSRPYLRHEGIQWRGRLYGGEEGAPPPGLEDSKEWYVMPPLEGLISMLKRVDAIKASLPEGQKPTFLDIELDGLDGELDMSPFSHVTCYRSMKNPAHVLRLMPGEPEVANPAAQRPYITHALSGTYMNHNTMLTEAERMHTAYMPLESYRPFRPFHARILLESTRQSNTRAAMDYTLSGVLSSSRRMAGQGNPTGGIASMRELLLRFAEDSGFSESLLLQSPEELTSGQLLALKLAREMLLCVSGAEPAEAYRRLIRLSHQVRRSPTTRSTVLNSLVACAESLYSSGQSLFLRETSKQVKKKRRSFRVNHGITAEEKRLLNEWIARHHDDEFDYSGFAQRQGEKKPPQPVDVPEESKP